MSVLCSCRMTYGSIHQTAPSPRPQCFWVLFFLTLQVPKRTSQAAPGTSH
jgi:hypothetical protein